MKVFLTTTMIEIHTQDHPMITCTVKLINLIKVVVVDLKEDQEDLKEDLVGLEDLEDLKEDQEDLEGLHLEEEDLEDLHLEEEDHHLKEDLVDLEYHHLEEEDRHLVGLEDLMEDLKVDRHLEEVGLDLMDLIKEDLVDLKDLMVDHRLKEDQEDLKEGLVDLKDLMDLIKDTDLLILMANQTNQTNQTIKIEGSALEKTQERNKKSSFFTIIIKFFCNF